MKLFIDARMLSNSGIGRYTQNILSKIDESAADEIELTVLLNNEDQSLLPRVNRLKCFYPSSGVKIYTVKEQFVLYRALKKVNPDLAHFPNFNIPVICPFPFVVTIHDLIYLNYPGACPNVLASVYARIMISRACRKARVIITDSHYSKQDIIRTLHISESKIKVIYPGVDSKYSPVKNPGQQLNKYNVPEHYVLYVGNHERRKNIPELIEAFGQSGLAENYHLVIAGKKDERRQEIHRALLRFDRKNKVLFTGYLSEEVLPALYSQAKVLAFPSSYEGFGLPVLEAMGCGTPVVCSKATSIPEVAGDAAVFVDPKNIVEFGLALKRVAEDELLRKSLIEKGFANIKKFSWEKALQEHINVYRETLNNGN